MSNYEAEEYQKLKTVVDAALQNRGRGGVQITTQGHDPSASVIIEGYVLEKFLTPPKSE